MTEEGYNGWKNYPTWAVHLWLTNEQDSAEACTEQAAEYLRTSDYPRAAMADALKYNVQMDAETFCEIPASMFSDLMGYALDSVDWFEVADAFLDAAREEIPA